MAAVTALEAKTRFGELLDRAARGEEIVITRHDKPVARMIPEGRPGLSVYAAAYLEVALRRRLPLASRDAALNKAAKLTGVKTLL